METPMTSRVSLYAREVLSAVKQNHGDIRYTPLIGEDNVRRGTPSRGWMRWERSASARLPPAESPVIWTFSGCTLSVVRTWFKAATACLSCVGNCTVGTIAAVEHRISLGGCKRFWRLAIIQNGNPDVHPVALKFFANVVPE